MNKINRKQPDFLEVQVGRIGVLKVHQISDEELSRLGQGSGQSLFLNLGLVVFSTAISFLIALITTKIESIKVFIIFVIITVVGFLSGGVLLSLWWCTRKPIRKLVAQICDRMPPEGDRIPFPSYPEILEDVPLGDEKGESKKVN